MEVLEVGSPPFSWTQVVRGGTGETIFRFFYLKEVKEWRLFPGP
jgi:hypothetical protein